MKLISYGLMLILSIIVAIVSWRFIVLGVETSMGHMLYHAQQRPLYFFAHVGFAPLALLLMPFQFVQKIRTHRLGLHRWMGRIYGLAILVSGMGGLFLAWNTESGPIAAWGFGLLPLFWLGTTARGIWLASEGRISEHRIWMIRSAALTFSAVTLRLYLPLIFVMDWPFATAYQIIAWAAWVPNLVLTEIWLQRRQPAPSAA